MKFLTDENIAPQTAQSLRSLSFEVKDVKEEGLQGSSDNSLIQLVNKENFLVVTFDKDFAKSFEKGLINTGVLYIVHKRQRTKEITERILTFLESKDESDLLNKISTID